MPLKKRAGSLLINLLKNTRPNILLSDYLANEFLYFCGKLTKTTQMQRDEQIFDLILDEQDRQIHGIELIASENFVSDEVMEAAGSVLTNK